MIAKIYPSVCKGEIRIPTSKSMSHRAIICAALSSGQSRISDISYSEDIKATIEGMIKLGADIKCYEDHIIVKGISRFHKLKDNQIYSKESGSTLRFLIPIFSLIDDEIIFCGAQRLFERPQKVYEDIFNGQNLFYEHNKDSIVINGKIHPGSYCVDGSISSQFISGLLFVLPLLDGDSKIIIKEPYESKSYVGLTIQMLGRFGIKIEENKNTIIIKGGQKYKATDYAVEGDYSQFAFWAVLGAINNDLKCIGLNIDSHQGDRAIIEILKDFGCEIETIENGHIIKKSILHPADIDLKDCPDLGPILEILMMYTNGRSRIYNAERLRYKESDRTSAMEEELKKCGADVRSTSSEIIINGKARYACDIELDGHNDHRIVMSLCIAATMFDRPVIITGAESINKSYPRFFEDLKKVGIKVELC